MENQSNCKCGGKIWGALLIALGLASGGFFPGYFYYQAVLKNNFVSVKGLAEMNVRADLAVWNIRYVATGMDLLSTQQQINANLGQVRNFLKEKGFDDAEIIEGRVETNDLMTNPYRDNNSNPIRYIISQSVTVRSTKVDAVENALRLTGELVEKGVILDNQYGSPVSYIFTRLNEIKPQMLEEATKNATAAAQEFAKSSDSKVGKIRRAQQGVFSILPREQTANAQESAQIDKKVRVVSTVEFWLE